MKTRSTRSNPLFRLLFWGALLFLVTWILIWGENSFVRTWSMGRKVAAMEKDMIELQAINDSLRQENQRLRSDPKAAEAVAREKFGLTKEGEKVFRFIPDDKGSEKDGQTEKK